jgi:hypothetical protein
MATRQNFISQQVASSLGMMVVRTKRMALIGKNNSQRVEYISVDYNFLLMI